MNSPDPTPSAPGTTTADERNLALVAHLVAFAGFLIPFGNIVGPLVVWLTQKDKSAFVTDQALESLNFQITVTIVAVVLIALAMTVIGLVVAIPGFAILGIGSLVLIILAAIAASRGERYRYPFCLRLVK
jgi:uncharacterized Tic20 family protein